jgi:putative membrane protein
MKKSFFILLSLALFVGCNSKNSSSTSSNKDSTSLSSANSAELRSGDSALHASNAKWDLAKEKDFVQKAAMGGMMEVELGKAAQARAMSQDVKGFGKMMVTDHSAANKKLKDAVTALQWTVPSVLDKDGKDEVDNLKKKSGKDFDSDYVSMMVDDHQKDVKEFEDAQEKISTPDLKTWVENTLPVLRKHLSAIQDIQQKMKNQ